MATRTQLSFRLAFCGGVLAGVSALSACSPPPGSDAGDATSSDVARDNTQPLDVANDANSPVDATDAGTDASPDVMDAAPDTGTDAGFDVAPDAVDASLDVAVDAPLDAAEASVDAATDTGTDAATASIAPGLVSIAYGATSITSATTTLQIQEPHNLVTNPGFETGDTTGWTTNSWAASSGDPAIGGVFGTHSAFSSYSSDTISQRVDLLAAGYTAAQLDASPAIAVRQWYHGGGYNTADHYQLVVQLLDQSGVVIATYDSGQLTTNGNWSADAHSFTAYPAGVRAISFATTGSDTEFWAGNYGSAVDQASAVVGNVEMRVSNDGTTWSAWMPFAASMPWTLSGTGTRSVSVQFRDAATMADLGTATDSVTIAP